MVRVVSAQEVPGLRVYWWDIWSFRLCLGWSVVLWVWGALGFLLCQYDGVYSVNELVPPGLLAVPVMWRLFRLNLKQMPNRKLVRVLDGLRREVLKTASRKLGDIAEPWKEERETLLAEYRAMAGMLLLYPEGFRMRGLSLDPWHIQYCLHAYYDRMILVSWRVMLRNLELEVDALKARVSAQSSS